MSPSTSEEPSASRPPPSSSPATTEATHALSGADDSSPPAALSGAPSAEPKPRPKKPSCAEGAYRHDDPAFCLRVPDGYSPTVVKSGGVLSGVLFQSNEKGTMDLEVTWLKKSRRVYDDERRRLKEAAKTDPKAFIGKCQDGHGLYVRYQRNAGRQRVIVGDSVHYQDGTIFWCKASAFTEPEPPAGFVTACQTLLAQSKSR